MQFKKQQREEAIRHAAAEFIERESNRTSLITVTRANISPDSKRATIYITVLPDDKEEQTLGFLLRKRPDFRDFLKKNYRAKVLPFVDFALDMGEKNRIRVEESLRNG